MRRRYPEREDARYLEMHRAGKSMRHIALLCDVSYRTVWKGVQAAKKRQRDAVATSEPPVVRQPAWVREMVPMFPVEALMGDFIGEGSRCPHRGPIKSGSKFVCMICHQSGQDAHPALQRNPATDPKPEPKPAPVPAAKESRKQRRKREAAEKSAKKRTPAHAA